MSTVRVCDVCSEIIKYSENYIHINFESKFDLSLDGSVKSEGEFDVCIACYSEFTLAQLLSKASTNI